MLTQCLPRSGSVSLQVPKTAQVCIRREVCILDANFCQAFEHFLAEIIIDEAADCCVASRQQSSICIQLCLHSIPQRQLLSYIQILYNWHMPT